MQDSVKVLGLGVLVNGLLFALTKVVKPGISTKIKGFATIKAVYNYNYYTITVSGICTESVPSELEYFDLSFYVDDQLGQGVNWAVPGNENSWTQGTPPSINEERSWDFQWVPPTAGTYALKARLYMRNTEKLDADIYSDPIEVTVGEQISVPKGTVSISAGTVQSISGAIPGSLGAVPYSNGGIITKTAAGGTKYQVEE